MPQKTRSALRRGSRQYPRRRLQAFELGGRTIAERAVEPASGASTVCCQNVGVNINANKTSPTSRPPGASSSRPPPTPKDLDDIPRYWPQAQAFDLPAVEYTAREVRSGLLFWAFAQRRSAAASSVFAARMQQHLERCGISLRDLV